MFLRDHRHMVVQSNVLIKSHAYFRVCYSLGNTCSFGQSDVQLNEYFYPGYLFLLEVLQSFKIVG